VNLKTQWANSVHTFKRLKELVILRKSGSRLIAWPVQPDAEDDRRRPKAMKKILSDS